MVELETQYAEGHRIENDFQTNGTLLNESWCEFFKEHDFYVGLSIDGPKASPRPVPRRLRSDLQGRTTAKAI